MGAFQFIVLFVMVHDIRDPAPLLVVVTIGRAFAHIWFDHIQLGQMSPAGAVSF